MLSINSRRCSSSSRVFPLSGSGFVIRSLLHDILCIIEFSMSRTIFKQISARPGKTARPLAKPFYFCSVALVDLLRVPPVGAGEPCFGCVLGGVRGGDLLAGSDALGYIAGHAVGVVLLVVAGRQSAAPLLPAGRIERRLEVGIQKHHRRVRAPRAPQQEVLRS